MRVVCGKDELAEKLQVVGRGVSTRTSVQILAGIMLRAADGRLHLSATDMEISVRDSLEARVEDEGAIVVPGRLLVDIVRLLPAGEVTLEHRPEEGVARLACGSASYQLNTYGPEDFPRLPEIEPESSFTVEREAFLTTIARVSRSASRDESRPVLTGVLVRFEDGKLVMAATDSYRLSVKETPLSGGPGRELEAIVPARALQELGRIGQASEAETLEVGVQENQVVFGVDGVWLTARRIDGQFPNYKQLLPEQFEAEVPLPREELLDVVRRTGLLAQRKSPLRLRFEEGRADGLGPDAGRGRGEGVPAGGLQRRAARDRLQRRVPARRPRVRHGRDRPPEAHQPAAPRPHPRRERRLPVPDHADQAGRLIVAQASLRSFRSYAALDLRFEPGLVLVVGPNGAGKTNLLEALHVGAQGFSPRTRAEPRLVRFGDTAARVRLSGSEGGAPVETEVTIVPGEGKQVRLNGAALGSAEELRARLTALVFVPDRLAVVKGGPAVRRAYVDRMLGRVFPAHAGLPGEYARAVSQRNEALRRLRAGISTADALEPWTERVAELGTELDAARAELVALLAPGSPLTLRRSGSSRQASPTRIAG